MVQRSKNGVSPSPFDDGGLRGCFSHEQVVAQALRPPVVSLLGPVSSRSGGVLGGNASKNINIW